MKCFFFQKIKYPISVFLIVANEFCERFSYYGLRSERLSFIIKIISKLKSPDIIASCPYTVFYRCIGVYRRYGDGHVPRFRYVVLFYAYIWSHHC